MQAHMRRHHIKKEEPIIYVSAGATTYAIPQSVANKYIVNKTEEEVISANEIFADLDRERTEAGALLKGLRSREDLNQTEFAKKIGVSQANLSKMEHGRRPIGKQIAKRIEEIFGVNYKYFLE
jgi:DNA-binding XRE family transcriptional regulator